MTEDRPAPIRATHKALFIINEVYKLTKEKKTFIVENALSDKFPKFSKLYDEGVK